MDLAVAAIIKAENIEVTDEDVEAEYEEDGRAVRHGCGHDEEVPRAKSRCRISS